MTNCWQQVVQNKPLFELPAITFPYWNQLRLTVWLNGCGCPSLTTGLTGDPTEYDPCLTYTNLFCHVFFLPVGTVVSLCGSSMAHETG